MNMSKVYNMYVYKWPNQILYSVYKLKQTNKIQICAVLSAFKDILHILYSQDILHILFTPH